MSSTFQPRNSLQAYLAPNIDLPHPGEEPDLFYEVMNERERDTASVVNIKENGTYELTEVLTSQTWFAAAGNRATQTRDTFRKVINFGALPNTTTKSVAHGIAVSAATTITKIYGAATNPTATDPNPRFIPLPYVDTTTEGNEITLYASDVNVYVVTAADFSAFTSCYVVLEYLQN